MKDFTKRIIVLDSGKYCILFQTQYNNSNYFLAIGVDEAETEFSNDVKLFEGKEESGKNFFREVVDKELKAEVSKKIYDENKRD